MAIVDQATATTHPTRRDALAARAAASLSSEPRPFLRWAGSKQRLLVQLLEHIPEFSGKYFEPFVGAGALYFLLEPRLAHLSDKCEPLIEAYDVIARRVEEVVEALEPMDVLDKEFYYHVRAKTPSDEVARTARFIYLNRAGWNGLYRVNNRGQFNVPYGSPRSANLIDKANLFACAKSLTDAYVAVEDFESATESARPGDLVYFDPPYVTGHNNNGFVDYNENLFSWDDQIRLSRRARELRDGGVHVVVSNANHAAVRELYKTFRVAEISRRSALASSAANRKVVTEAVFY